MPAIAQFRSRYVFLAPEDFTASFVDVVSSAGNTITIDGQPLTVSAPPIAGTSWVVYRQPLAAGSNGAHQLRATLPVGIQVAGYGKYTSYHYPGGMNLHALSTPPAL